MRSVSVRAGNLLGKKIVLVTRIFLLFPNMVSETSSPNFGLFGRGLTLYHTIPTFNDPVKEGFGKHWEKEKMLVKNIVGKGENAGNQHFLHFP